ncbi:GDP-mannose 4,6-dehydratase [Candidatus Peregrinibacteria bacterium]|nr:GDP-mannose 4,6-dehydratase [Candidatus Peregrinibacteria bacterium]
MKVLITGIGGFVGPYLKDLLEQEGHEVFGFERSFHEDVAKVFRGDLLNPEEVENAVLGSSPDAIVHLAGFSSLKQSFEQPELCYRINVEGTENLLKACVKLRKKVKVVIVGSAEAYGKPQFLPITEDHPLASTSPYGKSRIDQEKLVEKYADRLDIVMMRSFNHTGPTQPPFFAVPDFAKQLIEIEKGLCEPVLHVGNLEAVRDFSDVRDVVRAYKLAIEKGKSGETYNVCSGKGLSIKEILLKMIALSGLEVEIREESGRFRPSEIPILIGSCDKFKADTGFVPELSFEKTLRDMLESCP